MNSGVEWESPAPFFSFFASKPWRILLSIQSLNLPTETLQVQDCRLCGASKMCMICQLVSMSKETSILMTLFTWVVLWKKSEVILYSSAPLYLNFIVAILIWSVFSRRYLTVGLLLWWWRRWLVQPAIAGSLLLWEGCHKCVMHHKPSLKIDKEIPFSLSGTVVPSTTGSKYVYFQINWVAHQPHLSCLSGVLICLL